MERALSDPDISPDEESPSGHISDELPAANILIVDDDARNLYAFSEVLRDEKHHVVLASSGEEALHHLLKTDDFAVILLDIRMPGLDGYETAALIRSRERFRSVPIIFLTAFDKEQTQVFKGYEAGAVDYLFKPVDPVILKAKVSVFAELHRKTMAERVLQDQRLRAEQALRRREKEQSLILESLPLALYKIPLTEGFGAPRFVRGNIEELTGFSADRFLNDGMFWQSRIHSEDRDRVLGELGQIAKSRAVTIEYRWARADGTYRHLLDQANLVPSPTGGRGEIFGTWLDITERKRLEAKLQNAQKLEALGLLTGSIAHDFNNLLTALGGNLSLLDQYITDERGIERLKAAMRAIDRGEILTQELLAFSRKEVLQTEILDVPSYIQKIAHLLKGMVRDKIRLDIDLPATLWPVEIDPAQLERAMLNLAANARDAMPDGGVLRIEAENMEPQGHEPAADGLTGQFVAIRFSDTGEGIAPEIADRIFEPLFTTKEKGSGLGLSQVYGFAKQSGGTVSVNSAPGKGTSVTIILPRSTPPDQTQEPQSGAEP